VEVANDGLDTAQFLEFGKHQPQALLDLLIRVQNDAATTFLAQAGRQRQTELAPGGFLPLALVKADPDLVQFRFTHDPGQAQQHPVMIAVRIVEPLAVGEQHPEQGAQLKELVPVAVVAGQPRGVKAEHETRLAQSNLRDQALEALAGVTEGTGASQVLVDYPHPLPGPSQQDRSVNQAILQFGTFLMLADLASGRLAHVDIGQLGAVRGRDPIVTGRYHGQHGGSPDQRMPVCSSDGATGPIPERVDAASRPGGPAIVVAASSGIASAVLASCEGGWSTGRGKPSGTSSWEVFNSASIK
jgi:hypothetical protein